MGLEYPTDLRYSDSHEHIRIQDDIATIGITPFAVDELGDIVFVELPEVGTEIEKGDEVATIESVKAVSPIYAPVDGTIIEANEVLVETPEMIGDDPYLNGWIIKIKLKNADDLLESTLSAQEYTSLIAS